MDPHSTRNLTSQISVPGPRSANISRFPIFHPQQCLFPCSSSPHIWSCYFGRTPPTRQQVCSYSTSGLRHRLQVLSRLSCQTWRTQFDRVVLVSSNRLFARAFVLFYVIIRRAGDSSKSIVRVILAISHHCWALCGGLGLCCSTTNCLVDNRNWATSCTRCRSSPAWERSRAAYYRKRTLESSFLVRSSIKTRYSQNTDLADRVLFLFDRSSSNMLGRSCAIQDEQ